MNQLFKTINENVLSKFENIYIVLNPHPKAVQMENVMNQIIEMNMHMCLTMLQHLICFSNIHICTSVFMCCVCMYDMV